MWVSKVPFHVGSVLLCGVDFPTVLERLTILKIGGIFLSNFTVQSSHTQMIFEKFSNIVIFPKQIQSFLIGNFLSIWPTHKEFFPYMRIFRKINPFWYESFEKPYEGFSWAPPTKYVYFTKIDLSFLLFLYNLSKFSRGYAPNPKYIQSKMALAPHKHGGGCVCWRIR